ncbi:hypothetical protein RYX36_026924 [Vicia faba]
MAHGDKPPFECEAGHLTEEDIFRYKIEIEVFHIGKSCNFVFCNRECKLLLGLSAAQLRHTMIQDRIHDPLEFSLALDQMLDLEITFKVKWQPRWKNCSVVMILKMTLSSNSSAINWKQLRHAVKTNRNVSHTSTSTAPTYDRHIAPDIPPEPPYSYDVVSNSKDDLNLANISDSDDDTDHEPLVDSHLQDIIGSNISVHILVLFI